MEGIGIPASLLGTVHGYVRASCQRLRVGGVFGVHADAYAGRHIECLAADLDRLRNQAHDLPRQLGGIARALGLGEHDGELVAAQPGDSIFFAYGLLQAGCNGLQELVARGMAERDR